MLYKSNQQTNSQLVGWLFFFGGGGGQGSDHCSEALFQVLYFHFKRLSQIERQILMASKTVVVRSVKSVHPKIFCCF